MTDDALRVRRLTVLEEHFRSEVDHDWEACLAAFDGDRITNERVYLDGASLLRQIGRPELLPLAGADGFAADQVR